MSSVRDGFIHQCHVKVRDLGHVAAEISNDVQIETTSSARYWLDVVSILHVEYSYIPVCTTSDFKTN